MGKAFATLGEALHGGPGWRAVIRANGVDRQPPSSAPDRGYVEQPGEGFTKQQTLVRLERSPPALAPQPDTQSHPQSEKERPSEMAVKKKRVRVVRGEEFQKDAVRKVLARGGGVAGKKDGSSAAVAKELGVNPSLLALWVKKHREELSAESKTLVSSAPKSGAIAKPSSGSVDQAAKNLVEMLGSYITAVIDQRVDEAIKERMKRML